MLATRLCQCQWLKQSLCSPFSLCQALRPSMRSRMILLDHEKSCVVMCYCLSANSVLVRSEVKLKVRSSLYFISF